MNINLIRTFSATTIADIELPGVKSWKEIQAWYVKWGKFYYTTDGKVWERVELPEDHPEVLESDHPTETEISDPKTGKVLAQE